MKGPLVCGECDRCASSVMFASGGRAAPALYLCPVCSGKWAADERKDMARTLRAAATLVREQAMRIPGREHGDVRCELVGLADELARASRIVRFR